MSENSSMPYAVSTWLAGACPIQERDRALLAVGAHLDRFLDRVRGDRAVCAHQQLLPAHAIDADAEVAHPHLRRLKIDRLLRLAGAGEPARVLERECHPLRRR